jgi:hypothetical protein
VSPVKYELGFYVPEDGFLHSHRRGNLKSYMPVTRLEAVGRLLCLSSSNGVALTGQSTRLRSVEEVHRLRMVLLGTKMVIPVSSERVDYW